MTDAELILWQPSIPWGRAVPIRVPPHGVLGCRLCIARRGLGGSDVTRVATGGAQPDDVVFVDGDAWTAHMHDEHADVLK